MNAILRYALLGLALAAAGVAQAKVDAEAGSNRVQAFVEIVVEFQPVIEVHIIKTTIVIDIGLQIIREKIGIWQYVHLR